MLYCAKLCVDDPLCSRLSLPSATVERNAEMGFFSSRKVDDEFVPAEKSVVQVIRSRFVRVVLKVVYSCSLECSMARTRLKNEKNPIHFEFKMLLRLRLYLNLLQALSILTAPALELPLSWLKESLLLFAVSATLMMSKNLSPSRRSTCLLPRPQCPSRHSESPQTTSRMSSILFSCLCI